MPMTGILAAASPLGDNWLLIVGPLAIAVAIGVWISLTVIAGRRRPRRPEKMRGSGAHRGPVQGGVMAGEPSQVDRWYEERRREDEGREGQEQEGTSPRTDQFRDR